MEVKSDVLPDVDGHGIIGLEMVDVEESWHGKMWSIFLQFIPLSVTAFGGPQAHLAMFHERFVEKLKWLDDRTFTELIAVGGAIPGPTSVEVAAAIGALRCGLSGGTLAAITFQLPGFLIMFLTGVGLHSAYAENEGSAPSWLAEATVGVKPASVSLIFLAAHKLGARICGRDSMKLGIAFLSMFFAIWMPPRYGAWGYPLMLFGSGVITTMLKAGKHARSGSHLYVVASQDDHERNLSQDLLETSKRTGFIFLGWSVCILIISAVARNLFGITNPYFLVFEAFYRIGALIFGGGQLALPMLHGEVVATGWLPSAVFYDGLALAQALPGPVFNLSAYLGAAYLGAGGGILACVGMFAPGIIVMLSILPFWNSIRRYKVVQDALEGVNSAAVGLIAGSFVFMYAKVVHNLGEAAILVMCGSLVGVFGFQAPVAILISGTTGWLMMSLDLGGPYCSVPSYAARSPNLAEYCHKALDVYQGPPK